MRSCVYLAWKRLHVAVASGICNSPADRGVSRLSHRIRPRLAGRCPLARAISNCLVPCVILSRTFRESRLAGEVCEGTKNISFKALDNAMSRT